MLDEFKIKLDYEKIILICNENIHLDGYVSNIYPKFIVLKSDENKLYSLDRYEFTKENKSPLFNIAKDKGYEIIDITSTLENKITNIIKKEIAKYLENNKENTEYITKVSMNKYSNYKVEKCGIFEDASRFGKDITKENKLEKNLEIYIGNVNKGILTIGTERGRYNFFQYDIEKQNFNISDEEIMNRFYSQRELKLILAFQQYKQGKTPKIYDEIAKINDFLLDKKTVTLELYNGTKIRAETYLGSILDIRDNGKIFVSDRYSNKIIEGEEIGYCEYPASEIKCLKYGKNILNINTDVFKNWENEINKQEEQEDEEEIYRDRRLNKMNKYESVVIMDPNQSKEEREKTINKFKDLIKTFSNKKVETEEIGEKKLAYEIKQNKTGYYTIFNFYAEPNDILELERNYRIDDDIIKFIVVRHDEQLFEEQEDEEEEQ